MIRKHAIDINNQIFGQHNIYISTKILGQHNMNINRKIFGQHQTHVWCLSNLGNIFGSPMEKKIRRPVQKSMQFTVKSKYVPERSS